MSRPPAAWLRAAAVVAGLAATGGCAAGAAVRTAPLGAEEILRRAEEIRNPAAARAFEADILTVTPSANAPERQAIYSVAIGRAGAALAVRQSNDELRGAVLYFSGEHSWSLRPTAGLKEPYDLAGALARLGDWVALWVSRLDFRSGWQVQLLGQERYADEPCFKLELTRPSGPSTWTRALYWIGAEDFRPKRLEGYADGGILVNMVRYEDFTPGPLGPYAGRIVVEGGNPWEEIHTARFTKPRALKSDPSAFSVEKMVPLREAARDRGVMRKGAALVPIEEILE